MKSISFPQTLIIAVLMLVALVGVFSVPNDDLALGDWFLTLVGFKALGFSGGYLALRMLGAFNK